MKKLLIGISLPIVLLIILFFVSWLLGKDDEDDSDRNGKDYDKELDYDRKDLH